METYQYAINIWLLSNLLLSAFFGCFGFWAGIEFSGGLTTGILLSLAYSIPGLLLSLPILQLIMRLSFKPITRFYIWLLSFVINLALVALMVCLFFQRDKEFFCLLLVWSTPGLFASIISSILLHKQFYQSIENFENDLYS